VALPFLLLGIPWGLCDETAGMKEVSLSGLLDFRQKRCS
jgi:hypothetical protein